MVTVLTLIVASHGFKPRSSQTKEYKIGICCSTLSMQYYIYFYIGYDVKL
jgi:hypothetical protein